MSKNWFFLENFKIVNFDFWVENQWFLRILKGQFYLDNLNFRAKNCDFVQNLQSLKDCWIWQFLAWKFKFWLIEITIIIVDNFKGQLYLDNLNFRAKNRNFVKVKYCRIWQFLLRKLKFTLWYFFLKSWIFRHNLRFYDSVTQENQISEAVLE